MCTDETMLKRQDKRSKNLPEESALEWEVGLAEASVKGLVEESVA